MKKGLIWASHFTSLFWAPAIRLIAITADNNNVLFIIVFSFLTAKVRKILLFQDRK